MEERTVNALIALRESIVQNTAVLRLLLQLLGGDS